MASSWYNVFKASCCFRRLPGRLNKSHEPLIKTWLAQTNNPCFRPGSHKDIGFSAARKYSCGCVSDVEIDDRHLAYMLALKGRKSKRKVLLMTDLVSAMQPNAENDGIHNLDSGLRGARSCRHYHQ